MRNFYFDNKFCEFLAAALISNKTNYTNPTNTILKTINTKAIHTQYMCYLSVITRSHKLK